MRVVKFQKIPLGYLRISRTFLQVNRTATVRKYKRLDERVMSSVRYCFWIDTDIHVFVVVELNSSFANLHR